MKVGLSFANTGVFSKVDAALELAEVAESIGVDTLWTVDHAVLLDEYDSKYPYDRSGKMKGSPYYDLPDQLVWMTFVAARTSKVKVASGIMILPQRNPVRLAKELATLDAMSGGRVICGVGVGWLEEEFDALGVPFKGRGKRTDEYIDVLRTLWGDNSVAFDGEFVSFSNVSSNPKPTRGHVPIYIGGHSAAACARAGRLGDGIYPAGSEHDLPTIVGMVKESADKAGRDITDIEICWTMDPFTEDPAEEAAKLKALGVTTVNVMAPMFYKNTKEQLEAFGEKFVTPLQEV